jgi:hypothetical protein
MKSGFWHFHGPGAPENMGTELMIIPARRFVKANVAPFPGCKLFFMSSGKKKGIR